MKSLTEEEHSLTQKKTIVTSDNSIGKKLRHGGHVAAFNC